MVYVIVHSLSIFFVVLEILLMLYIILGWFPIPIKFKEFLSVLVSPILTPVQFLLKYSIFQVRIMDLSPIISFFLVSYLQQVCISFF